MTSGNQTAPPKRGRGRPKGSVGRRAQIARELVERLGVDPLEFLLKQVKNAKNTLEYRIDCAKACIPFVHPRLTTVFANIKSENVSVTRTLMEVAMRDPELAGALEKLSFMQNEIQQQGALPEPPHVIDIEPAGPMIDVQPALPEPLPAIDVSTELQHARD